MLQTTRRCVRELIMLQTVQSNPSAKSSAGALQRRYSARTDAANGCVPQKRFVHQRRRYVEIFDDATVHRLERSR